MNENDLTRHFFGGRKCIELLMFFNGKEEGVFTQSAIIKEVDVTFSYGTKMLNMFVDYGLLKKKRIGRKCDVSITDEGKIFVRKMKTFLAILLKNTKRVVKYGNS